MMEINRSKQGKKEVNMLPLINLVFLLLIFFLVAGTIEKFDIIPLEIPVAESGKVLDEGELVIILGQHDELIVNDELLQEQEFADFIADKLKENPDRIITLKADARLPAQKMIWAMEVVRRAGGKNLSMVTQSLDL